MLARLAEVGALMKEKTGDPAFALRNDSRHEKAWVQTAKRERDVCPSVACLFVGGSGTTGSSVLSMSVCSSALFLAMALRACCSVWIC